MHACVRLHACASAHGVSVCAEQIPNTKRKDESSQQTGSCPRKNDQCIDIITTLSMETKSFSKQANVQASVTCKREYIPKHTPTHNMRANTYTHAQPHPPIHIHPSTILTDKFHLKKQAYPTSVANSGKLQKKRKANEL